MFLVRARGTSSAVTQYSLSLTLSGGAPSGSTGEATPSATVRDAWLDSSDDGMVSPLDALMSSTTLMLMGKVMAQTTLCSD